MTATCRALEPLLSLHASGALEPEEAARLDAHLEGCPACRAELAAARELLGLVQLPAPAAAETLLLADLPSRTLGELRRRERRRGLGRRLLVGGAVAAAILLALTAPAFLRTRTPQLTPAELQGAAAVATAAAWEEPDPGALWDDAGLVDVFSSTSQDGAYDDAALFTYDDGSGI
jgi:anti-sigma factor RsiW